MKEINRKILSNLILDLFGYTSLLVSLKPSLISPYVCVCVCVLKYIVFSKKKKKSNLILMF